jgi:hypothetical protein
MFNIHNTRHIITKKFLNKIQETKIKSGGKQRDFSSKKKKKRKKKKRAERERDRMWVIYTMIKVYYKK